MGNGYAFFVTDLATARYLFRSDELEPLAVEAGVVTQIDLDRFKAEQEIRDAAGVYFAYFSMLMAAGRKP